MFSVKPDMGREGIVIKKGSERKSDGKKDGERPFQSK